MLYITLREKLEGLKAQITNLLGDQSNFAMPYKKFRAEAENVIQKGLLLLHLAEITQDLRTMLNDLNVRRNWFHHIPESLLIGQIEIANARYGYDYLHQFQPYSKVILYEFEKYTGEWLLSDGHPR